MPTKCEPEERARAIRMVREHLPEYASITATCDAVGPRVGIGGETLRQWVRQEDIDVGVHTGVTTEQAEEIARLKAENRRLREDVAILKAATSFFVGDLDPRKRP